MDETETTTVEETTVAAQPAKAEAPAKEEKKVAVPAKFKDIVSAVEALSVLELNELVKVFEDERVEFRKLMPTEGEIIKGLVVKAQNEWEQLKDIYTEEEKAQVVANADAQKAEDLKKSLGL